MTKVEVRTRVRLQRKQVRQDSGGVESKNWVDVTAGDRTESDCIALRQQLEKNSKHEYRVIRITQTTEVIG